MRDRPRKPVAPTQPAPEASYPTLSQEGVTRRAFLGAALGAGAVASLDLISVDPAEARGRLRGRRVVARYHYTVPLPRAYRCPKSGVVVTGVIGRTSSRRLQRFLRKRSNQRALVRIIQKALRAYRSKKLSEARVRLRVEAHIRSEFRKMFRSRTQQHARYFTLSLDWRPPSTS